MKNGEISLALSNFAVNAKLRDIPDRVLERAKVSILDGIGTALLTSRLVRANQIVEALGYDEHGESTIWGFKRKSSTRTAALLNGMLVEGLDYSDVHPRAGLHPTSVILPATLTFSEQVNASGKEVLLSYLIGCEAMIRIGLSASGKFHLRGFQPTSIVGVLGAALCVGRIMKLEHEKMINALSIATSLAFGSSLSVRVGAYYGGIDSGRAAESGILAAMLADHGLPGITEDSLEGKFGFLNTYAGEGNFQRKSIVDSLGQKWSMSDVFLKRYPISYACHQVVDAAIRLHSKVGYSEIARVRYGDKLENIRLFAEPSSSKKRPANMYDAKTSTYFLIALALAYGDVTSKFLSDKVREKKILQLFDKVQYEPDEMDVWVEADKKNGTPHKEVVSSLIQTDDKKLRKKYYENAEPSIGRKNAEKVEELIRDLERVKSIRSLTKLLLSPKL